MNNYQVKNEDKKKEKNMLDRIVNKFDNIYPQ